MKLCIFLALLVIFLTFCECEPVPGRKGGRSKSSSGGFSSWFGGSKKKQNNNNYGNNNNNYGSSNYGNNYGKKKSKYGTLKKAAVIGAAAYGGYQLGKLTSGYGGWGWGRSHGFGFNDWNRWREIDGFMCRDSNDCNWIDPRLYCQDYELDFNPSALWFGGDAARIVGECACPHGMYWDDWEMQCRQRFLGGTFGIIGAVVAVLLLLCCCCGAFALFRRFM